MTTPKKTKAPTKRAERDPLEVKLSVAVRFGEEEEDTVVLLDDRKLLMVGSVFRYRDKISRFMVTGLLKAAMLQPKVASKLMPGLKTLIRNK